MTGSAPSSPAIWCCAGRACRTTDLLDAGTDGVAERDLVIQFSHEPLARAAELVPELREVMALLSVPAAASSSSACPGARTSLGCRQAHAR